ncbi:MAG: heavy metal translocating P-type ATPase [Eubacteriales bacterium]|nr:heavy metal translocating P-type ATPase [Eubacteriales bacterium]
MTKEKFSVHGMSCSACQAAVDRAVKKLDGVGEVSVNLLTHSMDVELDESKLSREQVMEAVHRAGYEATDYRPFEEKGDEPSAEEKELSFMKFRVIVSLGLLIPLMYVSMGHMWSLPMPAFTKGEAHYIWMIGLQLLFAVPIYLVNAKYFSGGFGSLFRGHPNMDSLVAVGSGASILYSIYTAAMVIHFTRLGQPDQAVPFFHDLYFESGAMILGLVTLGKYLEARSKKKTTQAISALMELAPVMATIIEDGEQKVLPAKKVKIGDIFLVKPGEGVPVDGKIIDGMSLINEAALTGESIPAEKGVGDKVFTGTINQSGLLTCEATEVGEDTTLSKIIRLVEEAASGKAPIAKVADTISGIFVPAVLGIAVLTFIIWSLVGAGTTFALTSAVAVLVVSCPCALGLATPVAIMVGTGRAASKGILFKSAAAIETLHKTHIAIFDKTGTLTEGRPQVQKVQLAEVNMVGTDADRSKTEQQYLQIMASLEQYTNHPLGLAILEQAKKLELALLEVTEFEDTPGRGISAVYEGRRYFIGNAKWMAQNCAEPVDEAYQESESILGRTVLTLADEEHILLYVSVADQVRDGAQEMVDELTKRGVQVVMLTGDHQRTARAIADSLHIKEVNAEVLPQEKEEIVRRWQQIGPVLMVGDGINDAPALARADVGMAIGNGTDIAIESADVVLMQDELARIPEAVALSRATVKNIKENLFWAFFYNVLGIPLAAGLYFPIWGLRLSPMFGAAAMGLSSFFVVSNALRLRRMRLK